MSHPPTDHRPARPYAHAGDGTHAHNTLSADKTDGGSIVFSTSGGTLEIVGSAMPSATISGFTSGDFIDLASVVSGSDGSAVLTSGNVLDVTEGGSTYVLNLNPSQNFSGTRFVLSSDGISGTGITLAKVVSVTSGQTLTVSSGQTSGGVLVLSGGILNIMPGGTAIGITVSSGGTDRVSGTDINATLSGGLEIVSHGGVASGTTILRGGSQSDLGVTIATVVSSGTQTVSSGGTASNTVVSSGGSLVVFDAG